MNNITTAFKDYKYDDDKYRIAMREICSILDNESKFPVSVRPGMRSRIIEFTTPAGTSTGIYDDDDDDDDVMVDAVDTGDTPDADCTSSSSNSNNNEKGDKDYLFAVEALRSIIAENENYNLEEVSRRFTQFAARYGLYAFARKFFKETYADLHTWMYHELDRNVDTEEQVEATVNFFPKVLSDGVDTGIDDGRRTQFAVDAAAFCWTTDQGYKINVKAISFVPILVALGTTCCPYFELEDRDGILNHEHDFNFFDSFALSETDEEDELCLDIIKRLRTMGYFKKEDICEYEILDRLIEPLEDHGRKKLFRYFADWDPDMLANNATVIYDMLLLQASTFSNTQAFEIILEAGLHHFPTKFGFLFHEGASNELSPFYNACRNFGKDATTRILDSVFEDAQHLFSSENISWSAGVFRSAAFDEDCQLEGMYYVLRRDPAMLRQLFGSSLED